MARRIVLFTSLFALLTVVAPASVRAQRTVPINIESVPPGATVFLDMPGGTPLGVTPLRNVRVPAGDHMLVFQLLNHEEARLQVNVRRRRETFRAVLRALGTVEVSASNAAAQGARVMVDGRDVGQPLGPTPVRVTDLNPGRHQVRVEREGYVPFEQWVEVAGGQMVRIAALLEAEAPDTGSILVSGPPGAPIFVDGTPAGSTPTVLENIAVGAHMVEVRPTGQQPYTQNVTVLAGQRATVTVPGVAGATLRVLASAPGAVISVDGEILGGSPASAEGLAPGEHIVEARAEGYEVARQTVTMEPGRNRVISIDMTLNAGEAGRIVVEANVDSATVVVDGNEVGTTPVVLTPEQGPHAVVVRANGHQEYSTTCETRPGQNCEVNAVLRPQQVRVRVAVQPGIHGAQLIVDDQPVGPVPYDGTLPGGTHVIVVQAPGYQEYRQHVLLEPSDEARPFDVTLPQIQDGLSDEEFQEQEQELERRRGAAVTHSAAPLPVDHATLDISIGWPYLGELRLNVGLLDFLDGGFSIRSFGRLTEFEGRVRAGYRPIEQIAIGAQIRFGGGIGPELSFDDPNARDPDTGDATYQYTDASGGTADWGTEPTATESPPLGERSTTRPVPRPGTTATSYSYPINSAFLSIDALGSIHFSDQGAFTVWFGVDFSSDQYAGHGMNSGVFLDYGPSAQANTDTYCFVDRTSTRAQLSCPREDYARARLGGALELVLARNWNIWFMLEGILTAQPRRIMGNLLGIEANDTQFYFRIGTTHKF